MRHFAWRKRLTSRVVLIVLTVASFAATYVSGNASVQAASVAHTTVTGRASMMTPHVENGVAFTPPQKPDYTPVDPTKLQPDVPVVWSGGTPDPNADPNLKTELLASIHPTDLAALDAKPAPTSGTFKVNPGDKLDVVRMKKNGGTPVIMSLPDELTPSSLGNIPTEFTVWYKQPGCVQPPKGFDPGKATPEERNTYGFPPLHPGESVAAYDARLSWMKTRICEFRYGNIDNASNLADYAQTAQTSTSALQHNTTTQSTKALSVSGNSPELFNTGPNTPDGMTTLQYTGNVADEPCVEAQHNMACSNGAADPYNYTDTYAQWVLRGISGTNTQNGSFSAWMGLGGLTQNPVGGQEPFALVQAGSQDMSQPVLGNWYGLWIENLTGVTGHHDQAVFPWGENGTTYNQTVYSEEWTQSNGWNAEAEIGLIGGTEWLTTNSFYNGDNYGAATETAEEILEQQESSVQPKFSSYEFDAISVFDSNSGYSHGMDNTWHDWVTAKSSCGNYFDTISALNVNSNYSPPVTNTITWSTYC